MEEKQYQEQTNIYEVMKKESERVLSVKDYMLYLFVFGLPIIGIILACVFAFGKTDRSENIRNLSKASLFLSLIFGLVQFIIFIIFILPIISLLSYTGYYY